MPLHMSTNGCICFLAPAGKPRLFMQSLSSPMNGELQSWLICFEYFENARISQRPSPCGGHTPRSCPCDVHNYAHCAPG